MLSWPWVQIRSDYSKLSYWTYERQKDLFSAFKGHFLENGKKAKPQATVFQSRGVLGPVETLEIIESASPLAHFFVLQNVETKANTSRNLSKITKLTNN